MLSEPLKVFHMVLGSWHLELLKRITDSQSSSWWSLYCTCRHLRLPFVLAPSCLLVLPSIAFELDCVASSPRPPLKVSCHVRVRPEMTTGIAVGSEHKHKPQPSGKQS